MHDALTFFRAPGDERLRCLDDRNSALPQQPRFVRQDEALSLSKNAMLLSDDRAPIVRQVPVPPASWYQAAFVPLSLIQESILSLFVELMSTTPPPGLRQPMNAP